MSKIRYPQSFINELKNQLPHDAALHSDVEVHSIRVGIGLNEIRQTGISAQLVLECLDARRFCDLRTTAAETLERCKVAERLLKKWRRLVIAD